MNSNLDYVFDGYKEEGITEYEKNGLNQYTTVGETLLGEETVTPTSYSYDGNANLTDTGKWKYVYDGENRLKEAFNHQTKLTVRYQYDAKGRRTAKHVDTDDNGGSFTADTIYEYLYERAGPWCLWHRVSPRSP